MQFVRMASWGWISFPWVGELDEFLMVEPHSSLYMVILNRAVHDAFTLLSIDPPVVLHTVPFKRTPVQFFFLSLPLLQSGIAFQLRSRLERLAFAILILIYQSSATLKHHGEQKRGHRDRCSNRFSTR